VIQAVVTEAAVSSYRKGGEVDGESVWAVSLSRNLEPLSYSFILQHTDIVLLPWDRRALTCLIRGDGTILLAIVTL
jgi:hypothetical protein